MNAIKNGCIEKKNPHALASPKTVEIVCVRKIPIKKGYPAKISSPSETNNNYLNALIPVISIPVMSR
jgi:hypothetical protein